MKDIPAVETSDGELFTDREEAREHEKFLQTQTAIDAFISHSYGADEGKQGRGAKAASTRARTVLFAFIGWLNENNISVGAEK